MDSHPRISRNAWLFALAAGTVAFGIDLFGLRIFGATELIWGGVLPLFTAVAFGRGPGVLAAAIGFSATLLNWGHPWAWIAHMGEALAVGWFSHRRRGNMIRTVLIYWLLVGIPLTTIGIYQFTEIPFPDNWAIVVKYPVNGLLVALITRPLLNIEWLRRMLGLPAETDNGPLRGILFERFGSIVALFIVGVSIWVGSIFDRSLREVSEDSLVEEAAERCRDLGDYLNNHQRVLSTVAKTLSTTAPEEEIDQALNAVRASFPGFITLLCADQNGRVLASAPQLDPDVIVNVSDRKYFSEPMRTGRVYVSEVFRGRGFGDDLIVAMSVPILDGRGQPVRLVEGSLNLSQLVSVLRKNGKMVARTAVITDRRGHVAISAGALSVPILSQLRTTAWAPVADVPPGTVDALVIKGGMQNEAYIASRSRVPQYGWHVYLAEPVWSAQRLIAYHYVLSALAACAAIGLALYLASYTANNITAPLNRLLQDIEELANGRASPTEPPQERQVVSAELNHLRAATHRAAKLLSDRNRELALSLEDHNRTHQQLRQVLLHLDDKVRERTTQLEAALGQAEAASRAKGEFIASTSHELRTPLNVILGMSELLLEGTMGPLNARQSESVRAIEESGRHLLSLINDILDLSKIEAGKFHLEMAPTEIRDLCASSLRLVQTSAVRKKQHVVLDCRTQVDTITADPRRLKQVLVNLLSNAVKFTPDNGTITLEVTDDGTHIHFAVIDTGIGIAEENLARLFRPFEQIDGALNRRHSGTGLGLVLVRHMTQMHGGQVLVSSRVNQGSRFTVTLPLKAEEAPAQPAMPNWSVGQWRIPPGTHILIAEDNETNIQIYRQATALATCRFTIARDGAEALECIERERPDLVLMDVQMPKLDGLEVTRKLRADPRFTSLPIVVVTACAMPEDRVRCLSAGADAYLSKPVNIRELVRYVSDLLTSRAPTCPPPPPS